VYVFYLKTFELNAAHGKQICAFDDVFKGDQEKLKKRGLEPMRFFVHLR
jgi:hypothetical protein